MMVSTPFAISIGCLSARPSHSKLMSLHPSRSFSSSASSIYLWGQLQKRLAVLFRAPVDPWASIYFLWKFARVSHSKHVHVLCCREFIQASLLRLFCFVFFDISLLHVAHLGNKQAWHTKSSLLLNTAISFGFNAFGSFLQSEVLQIGSRQTLQVLQAILLHGGCKQS